MVDGVELDVRHVDERRELSAKVYFPLPLADEMIVTRFTTTTLSPAHRIRAVRLVYAFDEEAPGGRELLGGKGAASRR